MTLSCIITKEMNSEIKLTNGSSLIRSGDDLATILSKKIINY
jgi:Holliday junction resolvasome RuvABC ATP-dependent DNA helicase subunit